MSDARNSLKAATFKPVPGGWIYRAPNPWVFGDAPHFLVNDAQKVQIEAIIAPRRPILFFGPTAWRNLRLGDRRGNVFVGNLGS